MELDPNHDNILNLYGAIKKDAFNHVNLAASRRLRGASMDGWQERGGMGFSIGKLILSSNFFYLNNKISDYHSNWQRFSFQTYYNTKYIVPGYQFSVDRNEIRLNTSDSLVSTAMNYDEHRFYLRSNDSLKSSWKIDAGLRKDRIPGGGEMQDHTLSKTVSMFKALYDTLLERIIPTYYHHHRKWLEMMKESIESTKTFFSIDRMINDYYELLYQK